MDNAILSLSEAIPTILMGIFVVLVAIPFLWGFIQLLLPYSVRKAISDMLPWNRRK